MILAFDCAVPVTPGVLVSAKAKGFRAIGRYYGTPGSAKLLSPDEARLISDAELAIFCYFERYPKRVAEGRRAGLADGALALSQARTCGAPAGSGICFAVDYDATEYVEDDIIEYFRGAIGSIGAEYKIGVYGGGSICRRLKDLRLASYTILAGAMGWRGSRDYHDYDALQHPEQHALGVTIDPVELTSFAAVGAWSLANPGSWTAPDLPPATGVTAGQAIETVRLLQTQLRELGLYSGNIDGQVGTMTAAAAMRAWRISLV